MQCTNGERAAPEGKTRGAASVRCSRRVVVAFANDHRTAGDNGWHLLPCVTVTDRISRLDKLDRHLLVPDDQLFIITWVCDIVRSAIVHTRTRDGIGPSLLVGQAPDGPEHNGHRVLKRAGVRVFDACIA